MKKTALLSLILALVMCLGLVSCGEKIVETQPTTDTLATSVDTAASADETAIPETEPAAPETEVAETTPVTAKEEVTTEAKKVIEYGINGYGKLTGTDLINLTSVMPALLPDGTAITDFSRPFCFDDVISPDGVTYLMYQIDGKSAPTAKLIGTDEGAIYGTAMKFAGYGATVGGDRGELTISFYNDDGNIDNNVAGYRGILFYVDFSHVNPAEGKEMCASVTINTNNYRSNMADNGSKGYYYEGGVWNETKNINACRMQIPSQFKGWMYLPATSFVDSNKSAIADANGLFPDIPVTNMRLYTDGYTYATDETNYIIFDEVIYVK